MKIEMTSEEYNLLSDCMVRGLVHALICDNNSDLSAKYNRLLFEITQNVKFTDEIEKE